MSKALAILATSGAMLLVSCNPGVSPPEDSSGAETILPVEDFTLSGGFSTLMVKANTFSGDITVSLTEDAADLSDITAGTPASHSATLAFSDVVTANTGAELQIVLPLSDEFIAAAQANNEAIYGLVKEEGDFVGTERGLDDGEAGSPSWQLMLGTLDEDSNTYTMPFYATAERMTFVVARGDNLVAYFGDTLPNAKATHPGQNAQGADGDAWHQRPWVVLCWTQGVADEELTDACDPDSEGFVLDDVKANFDRASGVLTGLGWNNAEIATITAGGVARANALIFPQMSRAEANNNPLLFNLALFTNRLPNGSLTSRGQYYPNSKNIYVVPRALDAVVQEQNGDVFTHELFHAVQNALIPHTFGDQAVNDEWAWVSEGTAAMMGFFALVPGDEALLLRRSVQGVRRNWTFSLRNRDDRLRVYRTFEFFAHLNLGDTSYLMNLFSALDAAGTGLSYVDMDEALQRVFGLPLVEAYTQRVMSQRGSFAEGNDCYAIALFQDEDTKTITNESPETHNRPFTPLSSVCFDVDVEGDDGSCLKITLNGNDPDQRLLALGNDVSGADSTFEFNGIRGSVAAAGTTIVVAGSEADVRIIRDDFILGEPSQVPWSITFERDATCGNDLTGAWCAVQDGNQALAGCDQWGSFLRLTQIGNSLTGYGMGFPCEIPIDIVDGFIQGNQVTIIMASGGYPVASQCEGWGFRFDLLLSGNQLIGTYTISGGPAPPPECTLCFNGGTSNIILEKSSSDPNAPIAGDWYTNP